MSDRRTGQHITTFTFGNSSPEEIAQIRRIGTPTFAGTLKTYEQIVIPLKKSRVGHSPTPTTNHHHFHSSGKTKPISTSCVT
ncbi:MAG: hypothetical protein ACOX3R_07125 [Desulfitobacteriia bacterium]